MHKPEIHFILKDGANLPAYGLEGDAGLDIQALSSGVIMPLERMLVKTGVFLAKMEDYQYLRVAPRSKLAYKHGINVLAGVIEHTYRGEIGVILHNTDPYKAFSFKKGDAIAQLVPTDITESVTVEVDSASETVRGSEGINSTDERR